MTTKTIKEIMLEKTHIRDTLSREEVIDETLAEARKRMNKFLEIKEEEIESKFEFNEGYEYGFYDATIFIKKKLDEVLR